MASARRELDLALSELRGLLEDSLDWRRWIGRHAPACLALAFYLGWRLSGRRRST